MAVLVSGAAGPAAGTARTVQDAVVVEMSEVVPDGTAEAAEAVVVGRVEVAEAFGHQPLCAMAGGTACCLVSGECFVVPAQFSAAALL